MIIRLSEIWQISNLQDYKVHFAQYNKVVQPLEVWARDKGEWLAWQEYRSTRDDFNRPLIFSLIKFYHETDTWLFGGVFRVKARHADRYEVVLTDIGAGFAGRLKLGSPYRERQVRVKLEGYYPTFEVQELLKESYAGSTFPGYDDIDLSFDQLETIVRNNRPDWKAALSSVKGVYLITDKLSHRRYVGSAYNDQGIWSRWCNYIYTGHGNNLGIKGISIEGSLLDYCRANFRFALLDYRSPRTSDEAVIAREMFWKRVLLTRGEQGLNLN